MGENKRTHDTRAIRKFYLDKVNEYKREGMSETEANKQAEADTVAKYGRIPGGRIW